MKKLNKQVLNQKGLMRDAINILNNDEYKLVVVVDDANKLVGTVTDGDIRRSLLKNYNLNSSIKLVMHKKPAFTNGNLSQKKANELLKRGVLYLPILDLNKVVIGISSLQKLVAKKRFDNPVLLMAGGFGRRLTPLTDKTPKPLLKVGDKPILENIIDQFINHGFHNFYISLHYKGDQIKKYFKDGSKWNVSINYIDEKIPLGTGGCLSLLPKNISKLPLIVMNGDIISKINFKNILDFHMKNDNSITMCVREYFLQIPYGVVKIKNELVLEFEEKPQIKKFINAGIYILNNDLLKEVKKNEFKQITSIIEEKLREKKRVMPFPLHEYWIDIGQTDQLKKAKEDIIENKK